MALLSPLHPLHTLHTLHSPHTPHTSHCWPPNTCRNCAVCHTMFPRMRLLVVLVSILGCSFFWLGCPITQDQNPCCLQRDHSLSKMGLNDCQSRQGLVVSADACTSSEKVLETLCQRYVGFCAQSVGSCVQEWSGTLSPNPPWYDANLCLQQNILSDDFCNTTRKCFELLKTGNSQVTLQSADGKTFSTEVKGRATSQSIEIIAILQNKQQLTFTVHSNPIKTQEYALATNTSLGATLVLLDAEQKSHRSIAGYLLIKEIKDNKISGVFSFNTDTGKTYQGTLTQTPLPS